ncbi:ADP-ribose pyrophosphatase [Paenibacillus sp. PK3_47]|uniref:NUDIX hydrolase n=1 Tax=Paenibacillus sp. PK3_47 TaxID=2072642 RepID=UPI00201E1AD8|nr:NUDIX hydrolase [Paenibacillus sp. PK3_47]UQZ32661.1 ADP-ribose pyrophosphatase [Paenibacillus sp. PK3_47]
MEVLDRNGLTEREFLEQYRAGDYERPSVAADMVVFTVMDREEDNFHKLPDKELYILLIRRGGHPFLGKWALPGGFVQPDETAEQAAARELNEETGLSDVQLEQVGIFSDVGRDPRSWVISCSHMALVGSSRLQIHAGDDADAAVWFKVSYRLLREHKELFEEGYVQTWTYELKLRAGEEELAAILNRTVRAKPNSKSTVYSIMSNDGLAFDHAKIIACAIGRLREQSDDCEAALQLMPEQFTMTELQQVYEVIIGKKLHQADFRRTSAGLVAETGHYRRKAGQLPALLYRRSWGEG